VTRRILQRLTSCSRSSG